MQVVRVWAERRPCRWGKALQERGENLALAADAHLVLPAFFRLAFADGAVDEPAEFACLEFPGWAVFTAAGWTFFDDPAGFWLFIFGTDSG